MSFILGMCLPHFLKQRKDIELITNQSILDDNTIKYEFFIVNKNINYISDVVIESRFNSKLLISFPIGWKVNDNKCIFTLDVLQGNESKVFSFIFNNEKNLMISTNIKYTM
jgi:hypothetical protein